MNDLWDQLRSRFVCAAIGLGDFGLGYRYPGVLEKDLLEDEEARDAVSERGQQCDAPQEHRQPNRKAQHRGRDGACAIGGGMMAGLR